MPRYGHLAEKLFARTKQGGSHISNMIHKAQGILTSRIIGVSSKDTGSQSLEWPAQ